MSKSSFKSNFKSQRMARYKAIITRDLTVMLIKALGICQGHSIPAARLIPMAKKHLGTSLKVSLK